MTQEEYSRHLNEQLCWKCHGPTHTSHARQRECPKCDRKWSYARRQLQWRLAELFCQGLNAHQASRKLEIAYGTARVHFVKFDTALRKMKHPATEALISIRDEKKQVPERWQKAALRIIASIILGPGFPKKYEESGDFLMLS